MLALLFLAACGGKIAPGSDVDESRSAASSKASETPAPKLGDGADASEAQPTATLPATTLSAGGACAIREYSDDKILSADAPRCTVKNRSTYPDGRVEIELVNGDAGVATLVDGSLMLTCGTKGKLLFQAVIRCYAFDGHYTIAKGDLVLGDEVSDRKCRIDVDDDGTDVSGFVSCAEDDGPSELFSSNGAPVGLGAFTLPRSW